MAILERWDGVPELKLRKAAKLSAHSCRAGCAGAFGRMGWGVSKAAAGSGYDYGIQG